LLERKKITTPIEEKVAENLQTSEMIHLSGEIYTARDEAHKRMVEMIKVGDKPPFDFEGQVVYYAGPCPNKPGHVIGPVGPTTSGRMDAYSPELIKQGLKFMIGKGLRSPEVKEAIVRHRGMYFAAIGGAAALMSQCVVEAKVIAFEDLGTEAIRRLVVKDLPVVVAVDNQGRDIYLR
jgi:fumarate hydratase subunit beta